MNSRARAGAAGLLPVDEDLRRHADLLEILNEVSRVALEADDLDQLMQRVVDFIAAKLPVAIASILLLDESGQRFVVEAYSGELNLRHPGGDEWPITVGACGRTVRLGEPQLVLDPKSDPDYVPGNDSVESEYMVPIRYRDRILGVLNLESTRKDTFAPTARRIFDSLADQIAGAIHLAGVNRRLERANRELGRLAVLDHLTGIANRRGFESALEEEWRRSCREGHPLTILLADVDCFKALNDRYGHAYGDGCLRRIARRLEELARRAADTVARYGGEEFGLILPETSPEEARAQAERVRQAVAALALPHEASHVAPYVTVSVGAATVVPRPAEAPRAMLAVADQALYEAKAQGRDRVVARDLTR